MSVFEQNLEWIATMTQPRLPLLNAFGASAAGATEAIPLLEGSDFDSKTVLFAKDRGRVKRSNGNCLVKAVRLDNKEASQLLFRFDERTVGYKWFALTWSNALCLRWALQPFFFHDFSGRPKRQTLREAGLHDLALDRFRLAVEGVDV